MSPRSWAHPWERRAYGRNGSRQVQGCHNLRDKVSSIYVSLHDMTFLQHLEVWAELTNIPSTGSARPHSLGWIYLDFEGSSVILESILVGFLSRRWTAPPHQFCLILLVLSISSHCHHVSYKTRVWNCHNLTSWLYPVEDSRTCQRSCSAAATCLTLILLHVHFLSQLQTLRMVKQHTMSRFATCTSSAYFLIDPMSFNQHHILILYLWNTISKIHPFLVLQLIACQDFCFV